MATLPTPGPPASEETPATESRAPMAVLVRSQLPFLASLGAVIALLATIDGAPPWSWVAAVGITLLSALVTVVAWPRGGDTTLICSAVLQMLAVAVLEYAASAETPSVVVLMLLPALRLSYGFRGKVLPFVLACVVPLGLAVAALRLSGSSGVMLTGALIEVLLILVVSALVYGEAYRSWAGRAELARALAEARVAVDTVQLVADAIDMGVTLYDRDGNVQIRNDAMTRLVERAGYHDESITASHVYASDRETPVAGGRQPVERMLQGEAVDGDLHYIGAPGDQRAVTFTGTRLSSEEGPVGWVLTCHDVTELVNAVTTREEMILTFAHELRTPLTSIIGFAETLQDTVDPDDRAVTGPVEVIYRNASHLSALVEALVQAGALESAMHHPVSGDLLPVVRETVASFAPKADAREVHLTLEVRTSDGQAVFDPTRIQQALGNLISNALKYSAAGQTAQVVVTGDDDVLRLVVTDNGPGVDPQDLPQLFQRGFRSVSARRSATQGMGLGLAIARDIARAHGGDISVDSTPGTGSTFTLTLPRTPPRPPPSEHDASAAS